LGGAQLVSSATSEDVEDMLLDDIVQALDVDGGRTCRGGGRGFDQREQMTRLYDGAFSESGCLGDDPLQLAEIVGPETLLELGQRVFIAEPVTLPRVDCYFVQ
jgi:hypothetical protein